MNDIFSIFYLGKQKGFLRYSGAKYAYAYYKNYRIDLLTGINDKISIDDFCHHLRNINFKLKKMIVLHLMYELGDILETENIDSDELLAIEIEYSTSCNWEPSISNQKNLEFFKSNIISFDNYKNAFEIGYQNLLDGNCYQFNLTYPIDFDFIVLDSKIDLCSSLLAKIDSLSGYAHLTSIGPWNKIYFSNSPECLFQLMPCKKNNLWSMPIKGSIRIDNQHSISRKWKELSNSIKDQAELYMITDLIRNDLNKIGDPNVVVKSSKLPLVVPGILHQYSLITKNVSMKITLFDLIAALFPGGSITGAPKKNVMKILKKIEISPRGFYCGSTILWDFGHKIWASSINIRSAIIDSNKNKVRYHAGGGVTLKSTVDGEYQELLLKVESFLQLFESNLTS